jgi:uncharacterized protein YcsI (UPF0317 family)
MGSKFEIRSTKHEMVRLTHHPERSRRAISNNQNSNDTNNYSKQFAKANLFVLIFEYLNFVFVSDFDIRVLKYIKNI